MKIPLIQKTASSGAESLSLLFKPAADVVYIGMTPFALALRLGMPLHIVAIAQRLGSATGLVTRNKVVGEPSEPLVVATVAGSTGHELASEWALREGLIIRFLYLSPQQQVLAFQQGYVDGIACWEPFLTRAKLMGGHVQCDALSLGRPMFNVVCATRSALQTKGPQVQLFIDVHHSCSRGIVSGTFLEELAGLPLLFSSLITPEGYGSLLQNGYGWPTSPLSESDRADIRTAFDCSERFLERAQFPSPKRGVDDIFLEAYNDTSSTQPHNMSPTQLTVAHSDSLMCVGYHLAMACGAFEKAGFHVSEGQRVRTQRIALLPDISRTAIAKISTLVDQDQPLAAMSECRRQSEQILREVGSEYFSRTTNADRISAEQLIEMLNEHEAFEDQQTYAAAHWIRVIGNWAIHRAHASHVDNEDLIHKAQECLDHLVSIFEWRERKAPEFLLTYRPCRNTSCKKRMKKDHKCCPYCGVDQSESCAACGAELGRMYNFCPKCGEPSKKPKRQKVEET